MRATELLVVCRYSGAALIGVGFLTGIGGIDEILLLARGFGTGLALVACMFALATFVLLGAPGRRLRVLGATIAAFAGGAAITFALLGVAQIGGDHGDLWALVGSATAGIAVGARAGVVIQRGVDPALAGRAPAAVVEPDVLGRILRPVVAALGAGAISLLACGALLALGVGGVLPVLLGIGAACVLIVPLVVVALLLAMPAGLLLPGTDGLRPARRGALRGSALQPLPDVLASAIASVVSIAAAADDAARRSAARPSAQGDERVSRGPDERAQPLSDA